MYMLLLLYVGPPPTPRLEDEARHCDRGTLPRLGLGGPWRPERAPCREPGP